MAVVAAQSASISSPPRSTTSSVRLSSQVMRELGAHLADAWDHRAGDTHPGAAGLLFGCVEEDVVRVGAAKPFLALRGCETAPYQSDPDRSARDRQNGRESDRGLADGHQPEGHETAGDPNGRPGGEPLDEGWERWLEAQHADPPLQSLEPVGWYRCRRPNDTAPLLESDVAFHNRRFRRASDIALILSPDPQAGLAIDAYTSDAPAFGAEASAGRGLAPVRGARRQTKAAWMSVAAMFALAMGMTLAVAHGRARHSAAPDALKLARPMPAEADLRLRTARRGDGWLLTWDRTNAAVRSAKDGVLEIEDGSEHRTLRLDATQIADGSVLYTPTSKDVTFRLEIRNAQRSPVSDLVRVVDGSPSLAAAHAIPSRPLSASSPGPSAPTEGHVSRASDATSKPNAQPMPSAERPWPSIRESAARAGAPGRAVRTRPLAVALPAGSGMTSPPASSTPPIRSAQPGIPKEPAHRAAAMPADARRHSPPPTRAAQVVSSRLSREPSPTLAPARNPAAPSDAANVPARPLTQVTPIASLLGLSLAAPVDVEVRVRINAAGLVTQAQLVNPGSVSERSGDNDLLEKAALAAARQWIFEPSKRDGKNVPSEHTIKFHFRPQPRQP